MTSPLSRRVIGVCFWLSVLAGVLLMGCVEDYFLYFPARYPEGNWDVQSAGFPVQDCYFLAEDGVKLHGWFIPRQGAEAVVLWFHGNAGNISHRLDKLAMMRHLLPVDIFVFDYRGYGRSVGKPSEKGLYNDARAAYDYLLSRGRTPGEIYLYGQSLGAAVAAFLAAEKPAAGLVMEAAFSRLLDVAADLYPWLPARFITRERYDSLKRMPRIKMPLLIVHGAGDKIVAPRHSRRLYEAANEPKELLILPDGGHNDLHNSGGRSYWNKLRQFLRTGG